jgi:hypothetical protein
MKRTALLWLSAIFAGPAEAQMQMPRMQMNEAGMYLMNMASGTSVNPQSWPMPMIMRRAGSWNLMFMGQAFIVDTQQSGPRGGDKLYSANWFMTSAEHSVGRGSLMFVTMLSLEPATITDRRYPLLFQTGETAFGVPLVDAQHPHDFIMSLGVHYARPLSDNTMFQLYYAPVGDPALGPVAFPHRASAMEIPQAPLGHHWQDSTHIASNVGTVAMRHKWVRFEASGFHGTEPDENRWNIDWGPMNSWSGRFSVFPTKNWMAQVSAGRIARPERQEEGDVFRTTASAHYTRVLANGNAWSSSLIFGRNHNTFTHHNLDSYLAETLYPVTGRNILTGRIEWVDKDELATPGTFRIKSYIAGYTRDIGVLHSVETGIGANVAMYSIPSALQVSYGDRPWGINIYARFRLKTAQ